MSCNVGTFIDTIIVCSFTAFAIIATGAWTSGETGAALTSLAFDKAMPGLGGGIIAIALSVFAFTTILGGAIIVNARFNIYVG